MLQFERAETSDIQAVARLIDVASDGVIDHLYRDLIPGVSPIQAVAHSLKNEHSPYSYRSAIVARDGGELLGMALSYHASHHRLTDEMQKFFPADRLLSLADMYSPRLDDSWFLDALCVVASSRGQGVGQRLVELTKDKASEAGCNVLSLIVFADNRDAIRLYERTGFEATSIITVPPSKYIQHRDGCVLMKCVLSA